MFIWGVPWIEKSFERFTHASVLTFTIICLEQYQYSHIAIQCKTVNIHVRCEPLERVRVVAIFSGYLLLAILADYGVCRHCRGDTVRMKHAVGNNNKRNDANRIQQVAKNKLFKRKLFYGRPRRAGCFRLEKTVLEWLIFDAKHKDYLLMMSAIL